MVDLNCKNAISKQFQCYLLARWIWTVLVGLQKQQYLVQIRYNDQASGKEMEKTFLDYNLYSPKN